MQDTGTIFRIKKYALHDGPGIRTTVFFKGCPLACPWCHNPEGIAPDPQPMAPGAAFDTGDHTVGRRVDVIELVREIEKDQLFYDESGGGVTVSGGEPLAQPRFLEALLAELMRREIHTALDTSGFAPAAVIDRILPLVRLVLFDLKIMDPEDHRRHIGVANRLILDNLYRIGRSGTAVRIRVPLIPGMTDDDGNLDAIARVAGDLGTVRHIDLLPFHRIAEGKYRRLGRRDPMTGAAPLEPAAVARIKTRFENAGFSVTIGG